MNLFENSTLPGLRVFTPSSYALAAADANAQIGRSFEQAYNAAADRKQKGEQFDKELAERSRQFDSALNEKQRQFNIINPNITEPWASPPSSPTVPSFDFNGFADGGRPPVGQPSMVGERGPELFVPDTAGTIVPNDQISTNSDRNGSGVTLRLGVGWDGQPKPGWMAAQSSPWRATNALDAIGKVGQARTFDELSQVQSANPEASMYPQFQKALTHKSMILQRGQAIELRQKQIENSSVASRIILEDAKRWNTRVGKLDPVSRSELISMDRNKDGTISPAQWRALGVAEAAMAQKLANEKQQAELDAVERGDNQRTVISEKGVTKTFTTPKPASDPNVEPKMKTLPSGETVMWMPGSKGLHILKKTGEKAVATPYQATQLAKLLKDADDPDYTNFVNMAKDMFKAGFKAPTTNAPTATPKPAGPIDAPTDPKLRTADTVYKTPRGDLKWTGTGWIQP